MSEPVTNVEIEDVLSSIRRLVSNEDRQERREEETESDEVDKLVLTPSLRIDDTAGSQGDPDIGGDETAERDLDDADKALKKAREAQAEDEREAARELHEDCALSDENHVVFDFVDAGQPAEEDDAPFSVDEGADDDLDDILLQGNEASETEPEMQTADSDSAEGDPAEGDGAEGDGIEENHSKEHADTTSRSAIEERVAGLEAVVASRNEQWEPDGDSEDEYAGGPVEPFQWDPSQLPDADADEVEEAEVVEEVEATPQSSERTDPIVETAPVDDEGAEQPVEGDDLQTGENHAESAFMEDSTLLEASEAFLDEDALRDMVSEIVRQELQGALGERITRNVRKLVRREIHRALTSQQFE